MSDRMRFVENDGGRAAAGYKGMTGDCVARAVAIVTRRPYDEIYDALAAGNGAQRATSRTPRRGATAAHGISVRRKWFQDYAASLGLLWTPTMLIGQGCKTHLAAGELPMGRLVVSVSKHYTAVIDGVIYDNHDPQRDESFEVWNNVTPEFLAANRKPGDLYLDGNLHKRIGGRCVYGYWRLA